MSGYECAGQLQDKAVVRYWGMHGGVLRNCSGPSPFMTASLAGLLQPLYTASYRFSSTFFLLHSIYHRAPAGFSRTIRYLVTLSHPATESPNGCSARRCIESINNGGVVTNLRVRQRRRSACRIREIPSSPSCYSSFSSGSFSQKTSIKATHVLGQTWLPRTLQDTAQC